MRDGRRDVIDSGVNKEKVPSYATSGVARAIDYRELGNMCSALAIPSNLYIIGQVSKAEIEQCNYAGFIVYFADKLVYSGQSQRAKRET